MNKHQKNHKSTEVEQIKRFLLSRGFKGVSDSSSYNKIYSKDGTVIVIREHMNTPRGGLWEK